MTAGTVREIRPQRGPQEAFLASPADIVIYGGQAGGGKTWGLVVEPLRHIHNSAFRAVIFRRTFPQIIRGGGLQDEASQWYPLVGGKHTKPSGSIIWAFPSGAMVQFTHMQHEKMREDWQGAQLPLIEFDELTHFTEGQFFYMLSRNRSLSGVRPYIRATTNPDASSWVARFIAWWIDQETGYAIPERSGRIRWFARVNEELVWADDPAALMAQYPGSYPKSLTFIPARLADNRILEQRNPEYRASLMALPLVERERLLGGNWKIVPSGGKVFNQDWFQIIPYHAVPAGGAEVRFWDLAATEKALKGDDPDYTAGVLMRKVGETYYVLDCIAVQEGPAEVDKLIKATAQRDRARLRREGDRTAYKVRWELQPAAAGKRDNRHLVKLLDGFDAGGIPPEGDKITRAKPLAAQAEQGFVVLAEGAWNEGWLQHMHHQPDWPHDDIMDASSGAHRTLTQGEAWGATA